MSEALTHPFRQSYTFGPFRLEVEERRLWRDGDICADAATGRRIWHFQTVHHGIWDYDIASAPVLLDVVVEGRLVKAVAQVSKSAFTYVFNRATWEPPAREATGAPDRLAASTP